MELREHYPAAGDRAIAKQLTCLERNAIAFIALSPFLVMASSARGGLDASPRGDTPGFVRVLDDATLAIPDRPGNNRLDTLENLVENPRVGLIFFVPGMNETLRVNGTASVSFDPELLRLLAFDGKDARAAVIVKTDEVFFHCGKALIRSDLWNPARHMARNTFPTLGQILTEIAGGDASDAASADLAVEDAYRNRLY